MHCGGIDDDRKDATALHITFRPQLSEHRQCGLSICTFHLGFSLGQEQFFIEKEGAVAHRQVLSLPSRARWWRSPMGLVSVGIAVVVAVVGGGLIGTIIWGESGDAAPLAAAPTAAPEVIPATEQAAATPTLAPATAALAPAPTLPPIESVAPLSSSTPRPAEGAASTEGPVMAEWIYPVSPDTLLEWTPLDRDVMIALETGSVDRVVGLRFHLLPEIPQLPAGYASSGVQFDLLVHLGHDSDPIPYTFLKPLTLTVNLRAADATAAGGVESNLVIQRYDEGGQGWEPLATVVDFGAGTATSEVDGLSIFALTIREQEPGPTSAPTPAATTIPAATPTLVAEVTPIPQRDTNTHADYPANANVGALRRLEAGSHDFGQDNRRRNWAAHRQDRYSRWPRGGSRVEPHLQSQDRCHWQLYLDGHPRGRHKYPLG